MLASSPTVRVYQVPIGVDPYNKPLSWRVNPPRCADCGVIPTECPTCGDFQCQCPNPTQVLLAKGKKTAVGRVHYDRMGVKYANQFIDGYVLQDYPDDDEDLEWLMGAEQVFVPGEMGLIR